ncbi:hypothetical protein SLS62_002640 [Diatrype stigma]|uniref:Uncharacterized protein n=1 Tax=Diatrype stigma TaxID=117547 RepID=A0AAN9UWA6_9PEZI
MNRRLHGAIDDAPQTVYAKEVISAASWGSSTADRMSPALCKALDQWTRGTLSVRVLHGNITDILEAEGRQMQEEIDRKEREYLGKERSLERERDEFLENKGELDRAQARLLCEREDKERKLKEAKRFDYNEPTPAVKGRLDKTKEQARADIKRIKQEIQELEEEIQRHRASEAELDEQDKRLDIEHLVLQRDRARLKEELEDLAQPLYIPLYRSGGRDRPHITLRNLNPVAGHPNPSSRRVSN